MTQINNLGILRSKILKQSCDSNMSTQVNMLEAHVFKYGYTLNINEIITNTFTKIDNTVPSLTGPAGCYFFDVSDNFKLKNFNNEIVPNGFYRLKSNIAYYSIGATGWKNDEYYLYNIINGLPTKFAFSGYYIDLDHSILTFIDDNGNSHDATNGIYYYDKPHTIIKSINNIVTVIPDGLYLLQYQSKILDMPYIIFEIINGITNAYNEYFINIHDNTYFYNQKNYGKCNDGTVIVTEEKILIKTLNTWKYIPLLNLN